MIVCMPLMMRTPSNVVVNLNASDAVTSHTGGRRSLCYCQCLFSSLKMLLQCS